MNNQEAIERLKNMRLFMQINDKENKDKFYDGDYEANQMAIEALEKQIPKKPIVLDEFQGEAEGRIYIAKHFKCLTCGNTSTYFGGLPNNCHNCGQAINCEQQ